jgi:hypothetical protein
MQQKTHKSPPSLKFMSLAVKTKSFSPVLRNGWYIKFSIYRDTHILLNVLSTQTGQLIIRHFTNEDDACMFLNYIMDLDSANQYDL